MIKAALIQGRFLSVKFYTALNKEKGKDMSSVLPEVEKIVSIKILQNDIESAYSMLSTERDSIFAMEIVPYLALLVRECQNFMGEECLPDSINLKITDIRNHIKLYSERYGKTEKKIEAIDEQQNEKFKSQLRYNFLKGMNIHYNIGTYWLNGHVIGNTQQLASFLGLNSLDDSNKGKKQYEIAYHMGSFVSSIRAGLSKSLEEPNIKRNNTGISIKQFGDFNTNRDKGFFKDNSSKELNLLFLHLLCNMNFVKHVLGKLFDSHNAWIFRIEYVVTYYTFRALDRVKNHSENNGNVLVDSDKINSIIQSGEGLFVSKFRNCMMHYDLVDRNVLLEEYIGNEFYGLIESCFEGMNYKTYQAKLRNLAERIIEYLEGQFDYTKIRIEELDK